MRCATKPPAPGRRSSGASSSRSVLRRSSWTSRVCAPCARDSGPGCGCASTPTARGATPQAHAALEALAGFDLEYVEQPLAADDIDGLAALRREVAGADCGGRIGRDGAGRAAPARGGSGRRRGAEAGHARRACARARDRGAGTAGRRRASSSRIRSRAQSAPAMRCTARRRGAMRPPCTGCAPPDCSRTTSPSLCRAALDSRLSALRRAWGSRCEPWRGTLSACGGDSRCAGARDDCRDLDVSRPRRACAACCCLSCSRSRTAPRRSRCCWRMQASSRPGSSGPCSRDVRRCRSTCDSRRVNWRSNLRIRGPACCWARSAIDGSRSWLRSFPGCR